MLSLALGCVTSTPPDEDGDVGGGDEAADGRVDGPGDGAGEGGGFDGEVEGRGGPVTVVFRSYEVLEDRLCDLDADGQEDNAIADLGAPSSQLFIMVLNQGLAGNIEDGGRTGLHFPWVDNLSAPSDDDALMILTGLADVDAPDDPSDDFDGGEAFYGDSDYFGPCGEPRYVAEGVQLGGGGVSADPFELSIPLDVESLVLTGGRADGDIEPWGASMALRVCGYASIPQTGALSGFNGPDRSVLEEFLAGGAAYGVSSLPGLEPDVDVDGDGLERFILDEGGLIESCIDGDSTPIPGEDCWSDPRMADGFSLNVRISGVAAIFAGREPGWESHRRTEELCTAAEPDDRLLASQAHDQVACAELDEPCDPLKSDGPCCDPEQVCAGTFNGVYRCSAPCDATPCAPGGSPGMCLPSDSPSAAGFCRPVAGYINDYDCTPGETGCRSAESVCVTMDAGGWPSCFITCTPAPSGCDDSTHVCVPLVFGGGDPCVPEATCAGACVLRERFEEPAP